ncbi:MAG: 4-alpha-glucanotransferase [Coprobacillus sp.]|nr:4-alpha-glucanotransferase [Coprobacillus sp.]
MRNNHVGVLLPIASLPSKYGIGEFGEESFRFIDWLKGERYKYWQILPLNPLGPGDSPYMSTCSNAIDGRYISLDDLKKEGYITSDIPYFDADVSYIRYQDVKEFKDKYLYEAYTNYIVMHPYSLNYFKKENPWVKYYATYQYLKRRNGDKCWAEWKNEDKNYFNHHTNPPKNKEIDFYVFVQLIALRQWKKILSYAKSKEIKIISDVPFYCGYDSVEVWLHQDQFMLDARGGQVEVAGVPPDAFTDVGQLWGNPIYNFEVMKKDNYSLLVDRIGYLASMCDYLRLDHFRAFDTYYVIPAGMKDAKIGEWRIGPRDEFFKLLYKKYPRTHLIAEDLGDLLPSVLELRDRLKLNGMFIMEFTIFDTNAKSNNNLIVYPGTHDNETLYGWFLNLSEEQKKFLMKRLHSDRKHLYNNIFKYIYRVPSFMTIFQLQDFLKLDNKARTNCPGTVGWPNWCWKLSSWDWVSEVVYPKKKWFIEDKKK